MKRKYGVVLFIVITMFILFVISRNFNEFNYRQEENLNQMSFWDNQKKGTNFFNLKSIPENYSIAKENGIDFVRLTPSKWTKGDHDFLIGDVSDYSGLVMNDVDLLIKDLDAAEEAGIKVVVSMLSIPGLRYSQFNDNQIDLRIWQNENYMNQTALFWQDLANVLKDHPAIVGYNLINEPQPERLITKEEFWDINYETWYEGVENTSQDLNLLYTKVIDAIRKVDRETPIILDSGLYATPWAFKYLKKQDDDKILYSFHMYEPYGYTTLNLNNNNYTYPGNLPTSENETEWWDAERMKTFFEPIKAFQKKYDIDSNRILVGEFGCNRKVKGIENYFDDMLNFYNEEKWSWAFYSFREDEWDGMDYELGAEQVKWTYWEALENGENPPEDCRVENPIWTVIKKHLAK